MGSFHFGELKYVNNFQIYDVDNSDLSQSLSLVNMMLMLELFYLGLYFHFASSNYELDPNSNYNPNAAIENCDGPESNQLSEKECFCYGEPENDMEYSICKESGVVM